MKSSQLPVELLLLALQWVSYRISDAASRQCADESLLYGISGLPRASSMRSVLLRLDVFLAAALKHYLPPRILVNR